ncbi:uncharacterized protein LOC125869590 [Solanum stenotomum]|uniref:uncharacterized protein LOC125869590 n=1 Tax=Solanum stenotomum TaxID=172797 RepID=UPI0020D045BD|nr:uncharacterized protein LOC125869590 [Solanum stenotomum]
MAANDQESRVPLKLLIDDKNKRVIAAEANKDFVDILFSFLTFPIGTIIRLTNNNQPMPKISTCMNNLYKSVENLSVSHLCTENCKSILLNPRNPCVEDCFKLKVKIDDSVSNKYFECSKCYNKSWFVNVKCYCGGKTGKEIFSEIKNPTNDYSGVFVRGGIKFIISDDLRVLPGSPISLVQLFSDLGYNHMNQIKEMFVEVGKEEILRLLACSLISKSPLTEVFMNKQAIVDNIIMTEPRISQLFPDLQTVDSSKINLKLVLSKSRNKILYAEAKDSFVDFLFSFLTFPIGSVIKALNGISGLGCIDNLYKSVADLESQWFSFSSYQNRLLNPGVAPKHKCQNELLPILVEISDYRLLDPRDVSGDTREFGRFTKSPSLFIVSDDLEVKPMCSTSTFGILKDLNVNFFDIEEQVISIGKAEALCLLQAALTGSLSALTLALSSFLNTQKEEKD